MPGSGVRVPHNPLSINEFVIHSFIETSIQVRLS